MFNIIITNRLEELKRKGLICAIDNDLPALLSVDKNRGIQFARELLEDIINGHNSDLHSRFLNKLQELGIEIDSF